MSKLPDDIAFEILKAFVDQGATLRVQDFQDNGEMFWLACAGGKLRLAEMLLDLKCPVHIPLVYANRLCQQRQSVPQQPYVLMLWHAVVEQCAECHSWCV
jgi:hypothetical protein